jgi:hypothetical protein
MTGQPVVDVATEECSTDVKRAPAGEDAGVRAGCRRGLGLCS